MDELVREGQELADTILVPVRDPKFTALQRLDRNSGQSDSEPREKLLPVLPGLLCCQALAAEHKHRRFGCAALYQIERDPAGQSR